MRVLPSGTVTFLFTDVEGSTKLLHDLGAETYAQALQVHRRIVREACTRYGGVEVDTQGDALFVAFPTAPGALQAAAEALAGLAAGPIRVRIGIHTGTPHLTDEGYVGADVHRAARIAAAGHGGQALVSSATASLVGSDGLRDLREHRLKDLSAPERIYQLGNRDFPLLKSLHQTNLPIPVTPFLGRKRELGEVLALLATDGVRLLTLTGPGGTGKTRLALQAAGAATEAFPGGVWWVPLAALRDPALVLPAAAQAVGAKNELAEHIADKRLLLLFDNYEHVVQAAEHLAGLLAACPNLRVLVTSRELLCLPGEWAYAVPPLEPEEGEQLFLARALAADARFAATAGVRELCARLEQLPLALELAAARVRVLSPEQLLERLSRRLDVLKAGRGGDPRQQTLRATVEWSHDLLDPVEQRLFARLAVFAGGCTLEAAEEVCEADLDTLQSLVDKSLVRKSGGRFWMLETIREFAGERLEAAGVAEAFRLRHSRHFLDLAQQAASGLGTSDQRDWLRTLERDHGNLRVALEWALASNNAELALRLAGPLTTFWRTGGHVTEARRWFERALEQTADVAIATLAEAHWAAGRLAESQHDHDAAARHLTASLALFRRLERRRETCWCLSELSLIELVRAGPERAAALAEEAFALASEAPADERTLSAVVGQLAVLALAREEYGRALELAEWQQALRRKLNMPVLTMNAHHTVGEIALAAGELDRAREALNACLEIARDIHDDAHTADALRLLGSVAIREKRYAEAERCLVGSVAYAAEMGDYETCIDAIDDLAIVDTALSRPGRAAVRWGMVDSWRATHPKFRFPSIEAVQPKFVAMARAAIGVEAFNSAHEKGRSQSLHEAIEQISGTHVAA